MGPVLSEPAHVQEGSIIPARSSAASHIRATAEEVNMKELIALVTVGMFAAVGLSTDSERISSCPGWSRGSESRAAWFATMWAITVFHEIPRICQFRRFSPQTA